MPRAAKKVIATVEKIVDGDEIRKMPEKTNLPYFVVDAVAEVPYGAHPCSMFPNYEYDRRFFEEYVEASRTIEGTDRFLNKYVYHPATQAEYLEIIGRSEVLNRF